MEKKNFINSVFSGLIILSILVLAFLVLKPFVIPIILGLLLAYLLYPVYKKLNKLIKKRGLSSFILIFILFIIILVPLIYITPLLAEESFNMYHGLQNLNVGSTLQGLFPKLVDAQLAYQINLSVTNVINKLTTSALNLFSNVLVNLPDLLIKFFIFLFVFFFTLKDYDKLKKFFMKLSPFSKNSEEKLTREFKGITNAVLLGQVLVGVIQGLLLGLGLFILGFDNILIWTFIAVIASIIPLVGPWLVWVPLAIFSFMEGNITAAIILTIYGAFFVSIIDNILRPYFLSKSSRLPIPVSLIGTLGGLYFMGIIGLIIGPLILAYALMFIEFYQEGRLNEISKR